MSQQQLGELVRCLQRLTVQPVAGKNTARNRRKREKRRAKRQGGSNMGITPGTSGGVVSIPMLGPAPKGRRRNRRRAGGGGSAANGEVVLARDEFLATVKTDGTGNASGSVSLDIINFAWLSNLAKAFERVRWNYVKLVWRPAVGAQTDGMVAMGFDWGEQNAASYKMQSFGGVRFLTSKNAVQRESVLARTPCLDTQVWQRAQFTVPTNRLQSRQWYEIPPSTTTSIPVYDRSPGTLDFCVTGAKDKTMGEFWVSYSVRLSGTRKV